MSLLARLLVFAGALVAIVGAWQWQGSRNFKAGQADMEATVRLAGEKQEAVNQQIGRERARAVLRDHDRYLETIAQLENVNHEFATRYDRSLAAADRLRGARLTGTRDGALQPSGACRADQLRSAAFEDLLREGHGLVRDAGLALVEAGGLVREGQGLIGAGAALIELAKGYAAAVAIGKP
jgi:hypothetical protein